MIKTIIITVLICCNTLVLAYKIIPIGTHCSAAAAIKGLNLRQVSLPLDWIVSSFAGLYQAFNDDFAHFLEKSSLRIRGDQQGIVDYYGFQFVHDFPTTTQTIKPSIDGSQEDVAVLVSQGKISPHYMDFYDEITSKYARRIKRMYEFCNGDEQVFFIRHFGMNKQQAIAFRDLIENKFPSLDFILVVVSPVRSQENDWNLPKIRNFYLDDRQVWNNPTEWERIYKALGLSVQNATRSITRLAERCLLCKVIE
ncbi:MAG: DUF1796 family putative cysteine peptidase [Candidatus Dependentiae bacterium]|nr:DUF1796 family putative cysteine peptidase [Candidatus Dependentiae bacterium]